MPLSPLHEPWYVGAWTCRVRPGSGDAGAGRWRSCSHRLWRDCRAQALTLPGLEVHLCLVVGDALRAVHWAVRVPPGNPLEQVFQWGAQLPGCWESRRGREGLGGGKAGGSLPSQELPSALLDLC